MTPRLRSGSSPRLLLVLAFLLGGVLVAVLYAVLAVEEEPESGARGLFGPEVATGGADPRDVGGATDGGTEDLAGGARAVLSSPGARRAVEPRATLDAAAANFADELVWRGVVLDAETEDTIGGVELTLAGGPYVARAETDAEGIFELTWSAGLHATLSLAHDRYVDLQAPEVRLEEPGRFLLHRSARIDGRIRGGGAHEETRVRAWRQTASSRRFWESLEEDVAADGTFILLDLSPGDYAVTALAPGLHIGMEMGIHVEYGETAQVMLEAAPGAGVFGRVTRAETQGGLAGVELRVEPRTNGLPDEIRRARTAATLTAADGSYELTGLAPGIHRLQALTPWGADQRTEVHIPASGDRVERDLVFAGPARLSGFVVSGDGKGVAGATVLALSRVDPRLVQAVLARGVDPRTPRTTTGRGGSFSLSDLPAYRSLVLVAFPPGTSVPGEESVERPRGLPGLRLVKDIPAGEERRDVEVKLPPAFEVTGTVTDTRGEPLADATVYAEYMYKKRPVRAVGTRTDEDGRFRLGPLRGGDVLVRAAHADHLSQSHSIRVREGETAELAFLLEPCLFVAGVALDEQGFAVPHIPIGLRLDPEFSIPPEHEGRRTRRTTSTDAFGRFRIEDLFDAPWRVVGGSFEWEMTGADPAVLAPSREDFTTVTFAPRDRPERFTITGRVGLTEGGVPTGVRIEGLQGGVLEVDGGYFVASGLTPTRHRLRVFADGHVPRTVGPIEPVPGGTVDVGLIDLLPATRLTVRVVNDRGKAVEGARVFLFPLPVHEGGIGEEGRRIELGSQKNGKYRANYVPRFAWRLLVRHDKLGRDVRTVRIGDEPQQTIKVKLTKR